MSDEAVFPDLVKDLLTVEDKRRDSLEARGSSMITASATLVTLLVALGPAWPIDDAQGRLLITEFYQRLMAEGPAEALRPAAVSRMRAGVEIRDWAGFVLFGAGTWPWL